jgi:hypothetical protein
LPAIREARTIASMLARLAVAVASAAVAVACADAPRTPSAVVVPSPAPSRVELVCERDGTATLSSPVVAARPDGVHLVVDNRFDEPVSVAGFDADPGITRWTLGVAPGPYDVMCWPFSEHGEGEPPERLTIEVRDPNGLYVPAPDLACPTDERSSTIIDFLDEAEGLSTDPIEAVRMSLSGILESDELFFGAGGYPDQDHGGGSSVAVSRDGTVVAIVDLSLGDEDRWLVAGIRACVSSGIDLG